ncbi:hypothetical protein F5878DRAFT_701849 [Lentinula raphanica]|uniref:Uncharacterized protein n=1 Tax=Lentinula raphanica TaxID=153919 RepID=A0AA38NYD5_9AGAR|nr:hypothetical protein F5878DRAFT_701849 [Lentinula raphanica]
MPNALCFTPAIVADDSLCARSTATGNRTSCTLARCLPVLSSISLSHSYSLLHLRWCSFLPLVPVNICNNPPPAPPKIPVLFDLVVSPPLTLPLPVPDPLKLPPYPYTALNTSLPLGIPNSALYNLSSNKSLGGSGRELLDGIHGGGLWVKC